MEKRELPGHIAAALAGAGGNTDSAGQSWEGRDLSGSGNPLHNFDQDDGTADAAYTEALSALVRGTGGEVDVVRALATARVFVPIVAQLAEEEAGAHGLSADKQADMALVTVQAPDGRRALPVFTSIAALEAWHPEARPVAVYAARAALSAVAEKAELLVVDPGAELTFVVRRPGMWALAKQQEWVPSYKDEWLTGIVSQAVAVEADISGVGLAPGGGIGAKTAAGQIVAGGGAGPELRLVLKVREGLGRTELQALAARLQRRLGGDPDFMERVDSLEISFTR
ncbi:SseB family protein [Arthrobacter crystallopoietes]|uniref:SseB protein N-terminal domain-containing protein n=1 Tax=Crystallibacter crystallopoietes TaxID=37928 RepID=A0A1H1H2X1_9MICC|nr:SseB family protein [Arthrobacter crystallopoietes]SDR19426.1 SseB protein N-terminal domain-containing protein [Arthrobacter crystallopoietes]